MPCRLGWGAALLSHLSKLRDYRPVADKVCPHPNLINEKSLIPTSDFNPVPNRNECPRHLVSVVLILADGVYFSPAAVTVGPEFSYRYHLK